ARAQQLSPGSSMPGFVIAQAQFDAGRLADANRTFIGLQKFNGDLAAAEHDLGVIAFVQQRGDDAAWYLRKAVREGPRVLASRRAAVAAELLRKDSAAALEQLAAAQQGWPDDAVLLYLSGIAHSMAGNASAARADLEHALAQNKGYTQAQAALTA